MQVQFEVNQVRSHLKISSGLEGSANSTQSRANPAAISDIVSEPTGILTDMSTEKSPKHIGLIGAGIMGEALLSALIKSGISPETITIAEKRLERSEELISQYGVRAGEITTCDVILLVVKPQDMQELLASLKGKINPHALLITFAAGKSTEFVLEHAGSSHPVIRVMPNTASLIGAGMSAISLGKNVSESEAIFVKDFLACTGKVVEVAEDLQDAVTATSGSGPAYFFAFAEGMIASAVELGLSHEVATILTTQTMLGAARLLDESGKSATTLRENVTSPNGTTAAALATFSESHLDAIIAQAMRAARDRSQELA